MSARQQWRERVERGDYGEDLGNPDTYRIDDLYRAALAEQEAEDERNARLGQLKLLRPGDVIENPNDPPLDPRALARLQVSAAIERGRMDLTGAPRWPFAALDRIMGPMLPGDLPVIAAITGGGKSTFVRSAIDAWAERQCSTLYVPLETGAIDIRRDWAAWRLGMDRILVARNDWVALGEGSQEAHEEMLQELGANPYIHFATPTYINAPHLERWIRWSVEELAVRHVVVDHLQRMDHHSPDMLRHLMVHDAVRRLKDLGAELGIQIILAAQVRQVPERLDMFYPPPLSRLKDSSGVSEEATDVIVLCRRIRADAIKQDIDDVRNGVTTERVIMDPGVMTVCCRKKRLDDSAKDERIYLTVDNGRILDGRLTVREQQARAPTWEQTDNGLE